MTDDYIDPEKLRELQSQVATLPRTASSPDVWPQIRASIERERVQPLDAHGGRDRSWLRPELLAAAAALLVVASSGITVIAMRQREGPAAATTATPVAVPPASPASFVQFTVKENDYIRSANQLSRILESDEGKLAPETVAKLRQSIAVIDAAILEARQALAADPANAELIEMLSSSYDKKLDLLRRSAAMARS
ncbi:MAG: hypothetical protein H0W63_03740 [Gemmatimonadaceae bacterium]|nr:hypothetical protein [Gemmatimonadaceae bacterium]